MRLGQSPELSFAPAALHGLDHRGPRPRIDVQFFGLFGPNGPLPLHLTEYARERLLHHGDPTLSRFADMFHHRLLLLFYRAWAQAEPAVSLDRPNEDRYAAFVGSLIGIGTPALQQRDAAHDHAKLHFAGLFARQSKSAEGLASLLSGYLRHRVQIEQFAGTWLPLLPSERTRIGKTLGGRRNGTARLGAGAVLGATVWDRQHGFCIHIGPLDHPTFEALLPAGRALPAVVALVEQYVGHEFGWRLQLRLRTDQIRPVRPGVHGRLGWDSWLGVRAEAPGPARPEPPAGASAGREPGRSAPPRTDHAAPVRLHPIDALRALRRRQPPTSPHLRSPLLKP